MAEAEALGLHDPPHEQQAAWFRRIEAAIDRDAWRALASDARRITALDPMRQQTWRYAMLIDNAPDPEVASGIWAMASESGLNDADLAGRVAKRVADLERQWTGP